MSYQPAILPPALASIAKLVEGQSLTTGNNTIAHGLGRTPVGWVVAKDDAQPIYVNVTKSAAQNIPSGAATTVQFDSEVDDIGGVFDTSTYTLTYPHTGLYRVELITTLLSMTTDTYSVGSLVFSSLGTRYTYALRNGSGTNSVLLGASLVVKATAAETMVAQLYQTSGSNKAVATGSDEMRLVVTSDDTLRIYSADSTNLSVYSARSRTASFWVW